MKLLPKQQTFFNVIMAQQMVTGTNGEEEGGSAKGDESSDMPTLKQFLQEIFAGKAQEIQNKLSSDDIGTVIHQVHVHFGLCEPIESHFALTKCTSTSS